MAKDSRMILYVKEVKVLYSNFKDFRIAQVPHALNAWAYALSKIGSSNLGNSSGPMHMDTLKSPSIMGASTNSVMQAETSTGSY